MARSLSETSTGAVATAAVSGSRYIEEPTHHAPVSIRFGSLVIDYVVVFVALVIGESVLGAAGAQRLAPLGWLIWVGYFVQGWTAGGTVGMRVAGLTLVDREYRRLTIGAASLRFIGWAIEHWVVVSLIPLIFFLVYRSQKRPMLHDRIAGTYMLTRQQARATVGSEKNGSVATSEVN